MNIGVVALAAMLVAGGLLQASYLESDHGDEARTPPRRIIVPPHHPRPIPEPVDNPLTDVVRRLRVREGYHYKGLTVFLLELPRTSHSRVYLSTQEALDIGLLAIWEKRRAQVPTLVVRNRGRKDVLMLGGELLLGGKQNRTLSQDVLLPARSGPVELPVLCVEQGRWSGRGTGFKRLRMAEARTRGSALAGESQARIWEDVGRYQKSLGIESETQDLSAVQESPHVKKEIAGYRRHFRRHGWRPRAVGMVVARWGEIVGADIFANAGLFRKHRDRLLESYALDCIAYRRGASKIAPPHVGRGEAERFLRRVLRARAGWHSTPGRGRLLRVRGAGIRGSALVVGDEVVHAALFPGGQVIIMPPRRPMPLPIPPPHTPGPREPMREY
jgi:hypothetical protein